jgi:hypothetical protein
MSVLRVWLAGTYPKILARLGRVSGGLSRNVAKMMIGESGVRCRRRVRACWILAGACDPELRPGRRLSWSLGTHFGLVNRVLQSSRIGAHFVSELSESLVYYNRDPENGKRGEEADAGLGRHGSFRRCLVFSRLRCGPLRLRQR